MTGSTTDFADYVPLLPEDELAVGQIRAFVVKNWPVIIVRSAAGLRALLNRCSHAAAALENGRVRRDFIACPQHGAQFDLATGVCLSGTRYPTIRTFPLTVLKGIIAVQVPADPPELREMPALSGL